MSSSAERKNDADVELLVRPATHFVLVDDVVEVGEVGGGGGEVGADALD